MSNFKFTIEKTTQESIIKFTSNEVLTSGSYQYNNIDDAKASPLSQQLFHLPFVKRIFITANFIAIERFDIIQWAAVQDEVMEQIEAYLNDGGVLIQETVTKKVAIEVYAESTPNPEVRKFVTNKLLTEVDVECKDNTETANSPIAVELFTLPFVKQIFISENYISITKTEESNWEEVTSTTRDFIRNYIADGKRVVSIIENITTTTSTTVDPKDLDETSLAIISILDEYIKPAVASDGGNIAFESYDPTTQVVKVILQGACSGCPSSTLTLKSGIENTLKQLIPGKISEVIAINQ
ncbi:MAG: NifU family protein [Flavobacteriaceae bacterium]|nr:NifU family protein [Flavobacteriaceae bacterium]